MAPVTHIVLVNFPEALGTTAVNDLITGFYSLAEKCIHPETKKPYVLSIKGGKQTSTEGLGRNYTHGFVVQFASEADRDYYSHKDPAHREFATNMVTLLGGPDGVCVVDFSPET